MFFFRPHQRLLFAINQLTQEIKNIMSTVPTGLAALQKAIADDTAAVTANTAITQQVVAAYAALATQIDRKSVV